ncbi:MAG: Cytochrome c bioproteinis protein transmembrane region, partial [Microgenomates group bacterium Gr01-1014_16]
MVSVSLIAAFLAGIVALFAPCCITFLLPAYLGSVFKEKKRVMLMTLVFGAGIFVVLMPAVLGVSLVSKFVFRYHDITYYLGGVVMLGVGLLSLFGIKLPMPHFASQQTTDKPDIVSVFTLGVFSGLTSACCAPVLIGILALTFLTPSFWLAMLTGAVYVLGMITPLLISGYFIDAQKIFNKAVFNKKVGRFVLSNLIA